MLAGSKLLAAPRIPVNASCSRNPHYRGLSLAMWTTSSDRRKQVQRLSQNVARLCNPPCDGDRPVVDSPVNQTLHGSAQTFAIFSCSSPLDEKRWRKSHIVKKLRFDASTAATTSTNQEKPNRLFCSRLLFPCLFYLVFLRSRNLACTKRRGWGVGSGDMFLNINWGRPDLFRLSCPQRLGGKDRLGGGDRGR